MNALFFLKRNIFKFKMRDKVITSLEEYEKIFESESYSPLDPSVSDKYAVNDYNVNALFQKSNRKIFGIDFNTKVPTEL